MPIVEVQGKRIQFPDDMSPDDIKAVLDQQFQPAPPERQLGLTANLDFARGLVAGLQNAGTGAQQLIDDTLGRDTQMLQEQIAQRDQQVENLGGFAQAGRVVGETLPSMAVPGGQGTGLTRLATGVALDTATSLADPVREGESRAERAAQTGAFSFGLRGLSEGVSGIARRVSNAKIGELEDGARKLIDAADAEDIPIFFDDISDNNLAAQASVAAEYFGRVGTGRGRKLQGEAAEAAASRWLARVTGDNDDFHEVIQDGLKNKLRFFQRGMSRRYARVTQKMGDAEVDTPEFNRVVEKSIAAEAAKGSRANPEVVNFLTKFRDAPRGNFDQMIEYRSDFNDELFDFFANTQLGRTSKTALGEAKDALETDLSAFARAQGAETEWRAANNLYQQTVIPFKKSKLKALLNEKSSGNFDEASAWRYLAANTAGQKTRARKMWQSLDAKGRMGVRRGLLQDAYDAATREGQPFSPARFATSLQKRMDTANQFFKGKSGDELRGLVKVMRHIERAGQFAENPPTGNRLFPVALAGGTVVEPTVGAGLTGGALAIKGLFQTKAGRDALLAVNRATPGSEAFDRAMERVIRSIVRSDSTAESLLPLPQSTTVPQ